MGFYFLVFIFGLLAGSFFNVVIWRSRHGKKITLSRSACPHCHRVLGFWDLWPVLSFIFQGGRCRYCRQPISWQYPLVELATAGLFVLATQSVLGSLTYQNILTNFEVFLFWLRQLVFFSFLLLIFIYDWRWYLIPDRFTLPAMVAALGFNLWLGFDWWNLALGGLVGFSFFYLQYAVSRGHWIGGGDLRLGFLMGLMVGWPGVIVALTLSYFSGALVGAILLIFRRKTWQSRLPFGVFLTVATVVTLVWGERIIDWYLNLL